MKLLLLLIACTLIVYAGYTLVMSIIDNNSSMFLVAGAILCVAGVFCLIENKLNTDNP